MSKTLPISEVKMKLTEIVAGVEERGEEVVVTRNGRPAAVLVGIEQFDSLRETLDILSRPALMEEIRKNRRYFDAGGKGVSIDEAFEASKTRRKSARRA